MPALGFWPYLNIPIDVMKYVGAGGQVVNSLNVDKGITTFVTNVNVNSHVENIGIRIL